MGVKKLLKFIGKPNEDIQENEYKAMASFLGEGLFPYDFDMDYQKFNLQGFREEVGDKIFNALYPCALDFFFSNEYPHKDTGEVWNVIDLFLKKRGYIISNKERDYYTGLRDSYMDLYEIIHIRLNESMTLRSLLKYDPVEILVKEKNATHQLSRWDIIGGRVIKLTEANFLAGGALLLSRESANEAKESIELITDTMFTQKNLEQLKSSTSNPELMVKKMWAKEIAHYWFHDITRETEEPDLFNMDGDKLQFFSVEYPLIAPKIKVVKILNNLPEIHPHDSDDKYSWVWLCERQSQPCQKRENSGKGIECEIRIHNMETGEQHPIFAQIKIKGKKLVIGINSVQRRNIIENYVNTHLGDLVGKPEIIKHNLEGSEEKHQDKILRLELSDEEEKSIMNEFYSQHYKEWPDYPIPLLDGKTPREAAKNLEGRKKLIELLKKMQNDEERFVKTGARGFAYDFDWLFDELGIDKGEL